MQSFGRELVSDGIHQIEVISMENGIPKELEKHSRKYLLSDDSLIEHASNIVIWKNNYVIV